MNLEDYLNLRWTYQVEEAQHDGSAFYIIRVKELPGVCTDAATIDEGMVNIKEAMTGAFRLFQKQKDSIPTPSS